MSENEDNPATQRPVSVASPPEKMEEVAATITIAPEEPTLLTPKQPTETATNGSAIHTSPTPPEDEPATAEDKVADSKPTETGTSELGYLANNPSLNRFFTRLPAVIEKVGYSEMWGVPLKDASDPPTANVMIKFLRANEGKVDQAEEQLTKALEWRKKLNPLALAETSHFSASKFGGLGYITTYNDPKSGRVVFNWNIYGAVKNIDRTFGNLDEFIKWRVALMELAIKELKIGESASVINYDGPDPYQMIQVHDYQNVSFLRMNPTIKAASKQTIEIFTMAYPELLREKFFINLPVIMGWVFSAMKVFLSKNTARKFHPITNGANLAREFPVFETEIPKTYGGKGSELNERAQSVPLKDDASPPATLENPPQTESTQNEAAEGNTKKPTSEGPNTVEPNNEAVLTEGKPEVEGEQVGDEPTTEQPAQQESAAPEAAPLTVENS